MKYEIVDYQIFFVKIQKTTYLQRYWHEANKLFKTLHPKGRGTFYPMKTNTLEEYQEIIMQCRKLFEQKTQDYGTSWRIMRLPSITDQIYIKACRIRSIQEKGTQKVADDSKGEFVGIINYCVIALLQICWINDPRIEIPVQEVLEGYDEMIKQNIDLLSNKNHDYDEAWRAMRVSSMTDIILMKLLRIKQIEDNQGQTLASEGVLSGYQDMINYAVFCLILQK